MGAYHYAHPEVNNAVDEATFFVSVAGPYLKEGYLRPALDLEEGAGLEGLSQWVCDWMETVEDLTGVSPILYTSPSFATENLNSSVADYDLWIAHWKYDLNMEPTVPTYWDHWDFWQWSNESQYAPQGHVPGVEGNAVDLDVFNGSLQDLHRDFVIPLPGDVDRDRDVDIYDIVRMAGVYGVAQPDPKYDPYCDIDNDGDIDIYDIVIAAGNYGESW